MNNKFIVGESIVLSPLDSRIHLNNCYKWFNDEKVIQYLLTDCIPVVYEDEIKWFDSLKGDKNQLYFGIEVKDTQIYIGNVGLHYIDWISRTARTVTIIGEKEHWGKGFGTEAKKLITQYAFQNLNLYKLSAYILEENTSSIQMNIKCGFKEESRLQKQVYRNGKYNDLIIFSLMRSDWEELNFRHKYI